MQPNEPTLGLGLGSIKPLAGVGLVCSSLGLGIALLMILGSSAGCSGVGLGRLAGCSLEREHVGDAAPQLPAFVCCSKHMPDGYVTWLCMAVP